LYNPNSFDSNLIGVISFYCNLIVALDKDTFSKLGGSSSFEVAQNIASQGQSTSYKGWSQNDGNNSRFYLISDILSGTYSSFRDALYDYHFLGIDLMYKDPKAAKENILLALNDMNKVHNARPNAFLTRVFLMLNQMKLFPFFQEDQKWLLNLF